jgi:large subunit ribosomal protein L29
MASASELRELTDDELARRLVETKQEMFHLRFQLATGKQDNSARLGHVRRDLARALTLQRERELQRDAAQAPEGSGAGANKKKVKR